MATETIRIVVTESGTRRAEVNITRVGQAAAVSARRTDLFRRALFGISGFVIVRGLINLSDTFTEIENRLRIVAEAGEDVSSTFERIRNISNETRTPLDTNVRLYQRAALAASDLGASQQDLFQFTRNVGLALAIQGGTAQQARGALIQLSQAIGQNIVRAEEFNSILEGGLPIAQAVAEGLDEAGGSVARLRRLIIDGQVTSREFFEALLSQTDALEDRFSRTVPTIRQAFTILTNNLTAFTGEQNKATGAADMFADAIIFVGDNLDTIARGVIAGSFIFAVNAATRALARLTLAAIANPFTALFTGITVLISLLVAFQDRIKLTEDGLIQLGDFFSATFQVILEVGDSLLTGLLDAFDQINGVLGIFTTNLSTTRDESSSTLFEILRVVSEFADGFVGVFVGLGNVISFVLENPLDVVEALFISTFNGIIEVLEFLSDAIMSVFFGIARSFSSLGRRLGSALGSIDAALDQVAAGNFGQAGEFIENALFQIETGTESLVTTFGANIEAEFDRLREEDVLFRFEGDAVARAADVGVAIAQAFREGFDETTGVQDLVSSIIERTRLIAEQRRAAELLSAEQGDGPGLVPGVGGGPDQDLLARQEEILRDIRQPAEDARLNIQALNTLFANGDISITEYNNALSSFRQELLGTRQDVFSGFERGFLQVRDTIVDFASQAEETLVNAFSSAEDALVEFVQTGEFNFSGLVDSILADLTRLVARQALFGLLSGFGAPGFSFGSGGLGGFLFGGAREDGGAVTPGRAFLVGEGGPELFVPPQAGTIMPNGALAQQQPVNVNVVNVTDPREVGAYLNTPEGQDAILNVIARNPDRVRGSMRLPRS